MLKSNFHKMNEEIMYRYLVAIRFLQQPPNFICRQLELEKDYANVFFSSANSLRSNQFMTRDAFQQFWYTGVVLTTKLYYFTPVLLIQNHFGLSK